MPLALRVLKAVILISGTVGLCAQPYGMAKAQNGTKTGMSTFAVSSVRQVPSGKEGPTTTSAFGTGTFTVRNANLEYLIQVAYGVNDKQLDKKPSWLASEFYDISAKTEEERPLTYEQMKPLIQHLLEDRFHLVSHRETKLLSGYSLVVGRNGSKLMKATSGVGSASITSAVMVANRSTMKALAAMLWFPLGQPVVDETGVEGIYDIKVQFAAEGTLDSNFPSLLTAMREQLGLELKPQKVPIEMLVIDHVDKIPTSN